MIALNEANEYAAEVPFTLPLASDPLTGLTGWAFTLGEVQIRLPGAGVWVDVATNKIVEKGYGRFCARLTAAQCTTAGTVAIVANVTGSSEQPYVGFETIGELGGDIAQDGSGSILFHLPDEIDPVYGAPVTSADFTSSGTLRICLPDDAYRDATPSEKAAVVNLGFGAYAFTVGTSLTNKKGKIFLYAEYPGAQRYEGFVMILGLGAAPVTVPPEPTPIPSPIVPGQPEYIPHIQLAVNRLPQQFRSGIHVPADVELEDFLDGSL